MSWVQVSEDKILEAIEMIIENDNSERAASGLMQAVNRGNAFVDEGLTPFYIFNEEDGTVFVTSKEQMDGKLH